MPVSQQEVDELRREAATQRPDDVQRVFDTYAETLGFMIHSARSTRADQTDQLRMIELVVRATDMPREDIREARDTLAALGYGIDLSKLLTRLARRAKPKPVWSRRGRRALPAEAVSHPLHDTVDHQAFALLTRPTRKNRR